jgi:hypothetical protein
MLSFRHNRAEASSARSIGSEDMKTRRVVTGTDARGKSVFVATEEVRGHDYVHIPGMSIVQLWSTSAAPVVPRDFTDPVATVRSVLPDAGGTQLMIVSFPPDAVMMSPSFNPAAAGEETLRAAPGLAERFERDNPGMHTTDTIDYGIVLEGEIWLELDDEQTQHLRKHDVIVQNGTRHAWRNRGKAIARVAFVMIGAHRAPVVGI